MEKVIFAKYWRHSSYTRLFSFLTSISVFKEVCKVSIPFQERNFGIKTFTLLRGFLREFSFLYIKFISIKNLSEIACGVNTTSCNARKSIFKLWKTRYSFQRNGKKVFYLKVRTNFQALNLANLRNLK